MREHERNETELRIDTKNRKRHTQRNMEDYSSEIRNQKGINPPAYLKTLPRLPETIETGRETAKK